MSHVVVNTSVYSGDPRLEYQPTDQLYSLGLFIIFLSPFRKIL